MSRSGYSDGLDQWDLIKWRGQVTSAIRGKRGQKFLRDLLAALDAMPEKILITGDLVDTDGDACTIGTLARLRGIDTSNIDPEDYDAVAALFDIAAPLAREVMYENDEGDVFDRGETPEQRWKRMRAWVASKIIDGERPESTAVAGSPSESPTA